MFYCRDGSKCKPVREGTWRGGAASPQRARRPTNAGWEGDDLTRRREGSRWMSISGFISLTADLLRAFAPSREACDSDLINRFPAVGAIASPTGNTPSWRPPFRSATPTLAHSRGRDITESVSMALACSREGGMVKRFPGVSGGFRGLCAFEPLEDLVGAVVDGVEVVQDRGIVEAGPGVGVGFEMRGGFGQAGEGAGQ